MKCLVITSKDSIGIADSQRQKMAIDAQYQFWFGSEMAIMQILHHFLPAAVLRPEQENRNGEQNPVKSIMFFILLAYAAKKRKNEMDKMKIKLEEYAIMPTRSHPTDAGMDLYSPINLWLHPGEHKTIDTGVHVQIPQGYVGLITSKSGLMLNGITSRGTIDCGYTGSIRAVLYNNGTEGYKIRRGHKITQMVIVPCIMPEIEVVYELEETDRGEGGFGSTGK